jgi:hypothetical protein
MPAASVARAGPLNTTITKNRGQSLQRPLDQRAACRGHSRRYALHGIPLGCPQPRRHRQGRRHTTGKLDTWSYSYDGRGLQSTLTKPNGNLASYTYHEDSLPRVTTEKTSGGKLVSSPSLRYNPDGDRSQDLEKVLKVNSSEYLDHAFDLYLHTGPAVAGGGEGGCGQGRQLVLRVRRGRQHHQTPFARRRRS